MLLLGWQEGMQCFHTPGGGGGLVIRLLLQSCQAQRSNKDSGCHKHNLQRSVSFIKSFHPHKLVILLFLHTLKFLVAHAGAYVYGMKSSGDLFFWHCVTGQVQQAKGIPELVTHTTNPSGINTALSRSSSVFTVFLAPLN